MMDQQLKEEVSQLYAHFCSSLSNPTRMLLLYILSEGDSTIGEIAEKLCIPQSTVSHHLKVLEDYDMVQSEKNGQATVYFLADFRVIKALNLLRAVIADQPKNEASLFYEAQEKVS